MKYDEQKLDRLSLADLIALETFMDGRRTHWTKVASDFPDDTIYHDKAMNNYKICTSVRDIAAALVTERLGEIFPDYET
ncbi:MAG TPA: hypothetical protein VNI84_14460 [Pyrinomonadaceae bacterium]|nr:hypothetical protein [Pyrinomonadaceae bacterium]